MAWWVGVAVSFVLYLLVAQMVEDKSRAQFEYQADNAQLAIQTRIRSYMDVLSGLSALFYTTDHLTRVQFHAYVKELDLSRHFPGITSLNFAPLIPASGKKAFEAEVRSDSSLNPNGYPGFAIRPPGERAEYQVLTYLEPVETNSASFGFDIASNKPGADALAVSRDTGQLISSGRLIHITGPYRHIGLAMRIPLYRRNMPTNTVVQRRAAYYGSVGAGYDIDKLMTGAVNRDTLRHMRIRVYDTGRSDDGTRLIGTKDPNHLLFDTATVAGDQTMIPADSHDRFVKRVAMAVGPRVWEAEFTADKSAITNDFEACLPWLMLVGGLTASLLLYSIYYSLTSARRRAIELAREMTKDLRTSEARLAEAQQMAHLGSWLLEPALGKMTWSTQTYRILGLDHFTERPNYDDFLHHVHEDDRQRVREGLEQSMNSGLEFKAEHRIKLRDGTVRWVQTIARLGHNEHNMLLRGIIMDITERKQTVEALQRSQELLRELTAYQDRVKEDERKRIAREIHDELGQTLLALRIDVSMLEARTNKSHPKLNRKVRGALQHLDATVKTIRTIINNLRPAVLDLGLNAAIEWQVNEFRRRTGIACDLVMSEQEFILDDMRATSLFRILQESLTNVIRHANASHVLIELRQKDGRLVMRIIDNGVGIHQDHRRAANAFGLVGVEERILALDGTFTIDSAPGQGTTLTIYIPLATDTAPAPHLPA